MQKRLSLSVLFVCIALITVHAQSNPPALSTITKAGLTKDLYALADAHFRGRSAGTIDELKASAWLAEQYRSIGLEPAGDDGTYLQFFNMIRNRVAASSEISINGKSMVLWDQIAVAQMAHKHIKGDILYLGNAANIDYATVDVKGKIVALEANPEGINLDISLPTWRYNRSVLMKYGSQLIKKGATAILFVADRVADDSWNDAVENFKRGSYDIEGGPNTIVTTTVPVLWVHASFKNELEKKSATLDANIILDHYDYPSVNIIGKIKGTDPQLSKEYLVYSGHQDAHGVRDLIKGDSVYYGADDNASVDVAMLAIARAFKKNPGKRSVLFVIQGAEERGLVGSRWFVGHPTVPLESMVAVLNGDMIGRNNPDSAALLGVQPPHRSSQDLVNMALEANQEGPKFKLDIEWDKASHKEGWFFRSDHLSYVRKGIPSLMYSTLLHPDYHTPQDNAQNIDYDKLKKMTEWMYRTGWKVANAAKRPQPEPGFHLER